VTSVTVLDAIQSMNRVFICQIFYVCFQNTSIKIKAGFDKLHLIYGSLVGFTDVLP
jgi:hypothetical protein